MADTDKLRAYKVGDMPTLPGSDKRYLAEELKRISVAIGLIVEVLPKLEVRIAALEP